MGGCCFSTISWNHEEGPSEDPHSLAQHPGVLLTGSLQDFLAPPDSSAKPPGGQLGRDAKGRGAGRWLLRAAGPGGGVHVLTRVSVVSSGAPEVWEAERE